MAVRVFDITQRMINASDLMELGHQDVDQLLPAIIDIQSSLYKYPNLDKNAPYVVKMDKWASTLQSKGASDAISDEEMKQLKLDIETSFQEFRAMLDAK